MTYKKMPAGAATHMADKNNYIYDSRKPALSQVTKENREESYICRPVSRKDNILGLLKKNGKMTAREISYELGYVDLNAVKPRLSELLKDRKVEVVGKQKDYITGKKVAVYRRCKNV